jgi:hypothetical protein
VPAYEPQFQFIIIFELACFYRPLHLALREEIVAGGLDQLSKDTLNLLVNNDLADQ